MREEGQTDLSHELPDVCLHLVIVVLEVGPVKQSDNLLDKFRLELVRVQLGSRQGESLGREQIRRVLGEPWSMARRSGVRAS